MSCRLVEHTGLRHTPAGLPVVRLKVAHASRQAEGGRSRPVEVEAEVVAFGPVAERLARQTAGARVALTGFVDRKGAHGRELELHVTEFNLLAPSVGESETNEE